MTDFSNAELEKQIDRLRRADFKLRLTKPDGSAVEGEMQYRLKRHEFEFGTAISGKMLGFPTTRNNQLQVPESLESLLKYEKIVTENFSAVVAENEMKWYAMEKSGGRSYLGPALMMYEWARDRQLKMRGHTILWGVKRWQPKWMLEIPDAEMQGRVIHRMQLVLGLFKGKISEWDLNNEMMHSDFIGEKIGLKNGASYFKWAQEIDPDVVYYVNEFDVLQKDGIDRYVAFIKDLLDSGAKVGGIGDQRIFTDRCRRAPRFGKFWIRWGSSVCP
ncbi:MAG: hypothetical protein HC904_05395 [Blastochloris sp.]|nr:hypothetical protein [Blastochloris sp.]